MTSRAIATRRQAIERPGTFLACLQENDFAISAFKKLIQADEQQFEAIIEKITDEAVE